MSILDYGAIAFKNGKLVSTDIFTPMQDTLGFTDEVIPLPGREGKDSLNGNYFVLVGDKEMIFGFYKTSMIWLSLTTDEMGKHIEPIYGDERFESFGFSDYKKWKLWETGFFKGFDHVEVSVKPKNGYYVANIRVRQYNKGKRTDKDSWKVYFGYGVDYFFYKKTGRVNYYRSPEFFFARLRYKISGLIRVFRKNAFGDSRKAGRSI